MSCGDPYPIGDELVVIEGADVGPVVRAETLAAGFFQVSQQKGLAVTANPVEEEDGGFRRIVVQVGGKVADRSVAVGEETEGTLAQSDVAGVPGHAWHTHLQHRQE